MYNLKQVTDKFLEEHFTKYKDIAFEIGKEGPKRAIELEKLYEKFGKNKVDNCIEDLINRKLIIKTIST